MVSSRWTGQGITGQAQYQSLVRGLLNPTYGPTNFMSLNVLAKSHQYNNLLSIPSNQTKKTGTLEVALAPLMTLVCHMVTTVTRKAALLWPPPSALDTLRSHSDHGMRPAMHVYSPMPSHGFVMGISRYTGVC